MITVAFRDALVRLKITQAHLCRILERDKSTVNRWAMGASIPAEVSYLLTACLTGKLTVSDLERMHLDRIHGAK